jgi:uncharacterized membrane protein YgdD (TMEM256/DUF423 family)
MNVWLFLGSLFAGLAVAAGAFAAHGLDGYFVEKYGSETKTVAGREMLRSEKYVHDFKTGAEYQMYHSLALLVVGLLVAQRPSASLNVAGWAFVLGIVLFSGSLYVLTITGVTKWGMVTPIGGVMFLIGWAALAVAAMTKVNSDQSVP